MKTIKLPHVLFSLAVVTALVLAAFPSAPVYAMSPSASAAQATSLSVTADNAPVISSLAVVCRSITFWRDGHRITIRVCHRVHKHAK